MPASSWTCGLKVGPVEKTLRVHGPRVWRAKTRKSWRGLIDRKRENVLEGWELTEGQAVSHVPIDWRLAFGGRIENGEVFERNPIGVGLVVEDDYLERAEWPAPQIEDEDRPVLSVTDRHAPAGLGPIAPFWADRVDRAGTYDQEWLGNRHPLLPKDFDFRFWQAAHSDLTTESWLEGDEAFTLRNLLPVHPHIEGSLPDLQLGVEIDRGTGPARGLMKLDGVHFDMRPGVGRVFLTWRCGFPWPKRVGLPKLQFVPSKAEVV